MSFDSRIKMTNACASFSSKIYKLRQKKSFLYRMKLVVAGQVVVVVVVLKKDGNERKRRKN